MRSRIVQTRARWSVNRFMELPDCEIDRDTRGGIDGDDQRQARSRRERLRQLNIDLRQSNEPWGQTRKQRLNPLAPERHDWGYGRNRQRRRPGRGSGGGLVGDPAEARGIYYQDF